jgi:WD40 repeat protein/tRNA A-37 threonylcarbamoyl transferase component Bud32
MDRANCLTPEELSAFQTGDLPESELDRVAEHLEHCPRCEAAARALDGCADGLVGLLRDHAPTVPLPPRAEVSHTLSALKVLAQARQAAPERRFPDRVGNYEVLGELGRGNMGVVYRARHVTLGRVVALKMLLDGEFADQERRARFQREAQAVAQLHHPNIVQIYEVGEQDQLPYLALELVEGRSLEQHLAGKPQHARETAALLETVARAVHHAHERGIIHRDLKPANVLLQGQAQGLQSLGFGLGVPKLADFGVARRLTAGPDQTRDGDVIGTPSYMAPEQAGGQLHQVGAATDVYALGAILYEMLTGRVPLLGEDPLETLWLVRTRDPVPPSQLQPKVPRDLETICLKCLEKDPARRYASALELAEDCAAFREGKPILARPVGPVERAWQWCRRHPAQAGSLLAVALTLLLGSAVAWWFAVQATASARRADEKALEAEANARSAHERAYIADLRLVQRSYEDSLLDRVRDLLDGQRPDRTGGVDLRGFEWHYWWRLSHADLRTLPLPPAVRTVAFSPDGKWLAASGGDSRVGIWDAPSGLRMLLLEEPGQTRGLAFRPDSREFATACLDNTVGVWDVRRGVRLRTLQGHTGRVWSVAYSPEGKRLASASEDHTVGVWDAHSGVRLLTLQGHTDKVYGVAFDPGGGKDGTPPLLASAGDDRTVRVWDARAGTCLRTLEGHTETVSRVAFSPDGSRLASASMDGTVGVWDPRRGVRLLTLKDQMINAHAVAFSPDGTRLASACQDRTVRVWDARSGALLLTLKGHGAPVSSVAFTPEDGSPPLLASGSDDGTVKVWDPFRSPEIPPLQGHKSEVTSVACSPDGRFLASAGGNWEGRANGYVNGELKVWEAATGRHLLDLKAQASGVTCVAFSPAGAGDVGTPPLLASASGTWDEDKNRYVRGEVKLWDPVTGAEKASFTGHASAVLSLAFSPTGQLLASAGFDRVVKVWDVPAQRERFTLGGHRDTVSAVAFSPDGRFLATASFEGVLKLWEVQGGSEIWSRRIGFTPAGVAFSPNGKRLAVAGYSAELKVYETTTGQEALVLKGHTRGAANVTFSPDGKRIAAACEDTTVRLWDTASGQEILTLKGHTNIVRSVAFSPDGRRIVSGGWDRTVRIWDATPP